MSDFAYDTTDEGGLIAIDVTACERQVRSAAGFFDSVTAERALIQELDVLREQLKMANERAGKAERRALRAEKALLRRAAPTDTEQP